jgi:hypothetical protein
MTTDAVTTFSPQGTVSLSVGKTIILSSLLDGRWIENEYQLNDQNWRDALKLFRDIGTRVRMTYK